jgi:hypothetical protein
MNYLPAVFFGVFALVQSGVLLMSWSVLSREEGVKGQIFYHLSLVFGILAALGLGYSVLPHLQRGPLGWTHTPSSMAYLLTFSNILFFYISQLREVTRAQWFSMVLVTLGWGVWFDYLRQYGNFSERTLLLSAPLVLIWLAQWKVLSRLIRQTPSRRLFALKIITLISLTLLMVRLVLFQFDALPSNFSVEQMPSILVFLICFQFALHLLELSAVSGYWLEQMISRRQTVLFENQRIKQLLSEKIALINYLSRLHTVAETGALSASLAHEINQPLSAVQLDAQMLQVLLKERSDAEETFPLLQRIVANNARAAQTVQNLRNLFGSSQEPPVLAQVDLVIEQALDLTISLLHKNNVQMWPKLAAPAPVLIACQELQMVLINLINNACEALHDTPDARIDITTWQANGQTCIQVADNGPGIAPDEQAQIFNLLKTSKAQGTGIGLWLSRQLIERQGGHLTLEPSASGAQFLITFPKS